MGILQLVASCWFGPLCFGRTILLSAVNVPAAVCIVLLECVEVQVQVLLLYHEVVNHLAGEGRGEMRVSRRDNL